jgi:serine protease
VLADHEDLRGAVAARFDSTGQGSPTDPAPWDAHGTECAALVGGTHRVSAGVKGVAAGCALASVRVGYTPTRLGDYVTKVSWIVAGVDWAWQHGAAVLNMSFGGGPPSTPVARALDRARARGRGGKGSVLVAAVGNSGISGVEFPASHDGVIGVAALGPSDRPASFSNRGPEVDLAAPGTNVYTATIPDPVEGEKARYCQDSGTSLATPLVAGAAALVLAANPSLREAAVRQILVATARRVPGQSVSHGRNDRVGAGRLDVARAVTRARRAR